MSDAQRRQDETYRGLFPYVNPRHITNGEERLMSTIGDAVTTMSFIRGYVGEDERVEDMSIADAFTCLGGNTYFFAQAFREVDAYEVDETRRGHLRENIAAYYKRGNVAVYADCGVGQHSIFADYHDVVFIDPPWFNPSTLDPRNPKSGVVDGYVFELVLRICARLAEAASTRYVFVKLPLREFHADSFARLEEEMGKKWSGIDTRIISRRRGATYTIVCARLTNKSTEDATAMPSSEQIYVSVLKSMLGEWRLRFLQPKIKEWMQEFLDEKLSAEIIRYTMLTCPDLRTEHILEDRLRDMFGSIFRLMVEEGLEISVTLAWRLIHNSIQYGDPPDRTTDVWYSWRLCCEAKKIHDEMAVSINKRGRTEPPGQRGGHGRGGG
jgi:hypothetical protein